MQIKNTPVLNKDVIYSFLILLFILMPVNAACTNMSDTNRDLTTSDINMDVQDSMVFKNPISAYELYRAFQINPEKAKQLYIGKTITVTGVAVYVGPDIYTLPSVELSDKAKGTSYVLCVLPFSDYLKLRNVSKGKNVSMTGECRHLGDDGWIIMKQCKINN